MAGRVDRHGRREVPAAAAEVGRVHEDRIDDQRLRFVVGGHVESDVPRAAHRVPSGDSSPDAIDILIQERLALAHLATCGVQNEVAVTVDANPVGATETEADSPGIGSWRYMEVVDSNSLCFP